MLDAGDLFLRDSILPLPVRPGDSVALNKVIKLPGGMDGGTYQVIMEINPGEHTPESDMSNNTLASAPIQVAIQSHFDSVSLNKLYIRPGSAATLTAHNLTNFDPDAGQVNFYIGTDNGLGGGYPDFGHLTLLGTGTRHGTDYTLSFVADGSLLANSNYFVAEAIKRNGGGGSAWTTVEEPKTSSARDLDRFPSRRYRSRAASPSHSRPLGFQDELATSFRRVTTLTSITSSAVSFAFPDPLRPDPRDLPRNPGS